MRLIDADELRLLIQREYNTDDSDYPTQYQFGLQYTMTAIDKAPTVEPQPEITLESAIDYLHSIGWMQEHDELMYKQGYKHGKSKGIKRGMAMAQRMKGRWIHDGCDIPHGVDWMHCSVCGRREPYVPAAMTNYCPTCGTEMETEQQ